MAAIILYALGLAANVLAWTQEGHRLVASLASTRLNGNAEDLIRNYLQVPDGTVVSALVLASTWADDIVEERPETGRFHFVNTPYRDCKPYDAARDCEGGICIVTAIAKFAQTVIDLDASKTDRMEAVKFLVHLMADIHQPLHVSFRNDAGGTRIALRDPELTLHEIWDRIPVGLDPKISAMQTSNMDIDAFAASIASETSTKYTCKTAYQHLGPDLQWIESGDVLSEGYLKRQKIVANIQLGQAASRLAALLNELGTIYMRRYFERNPLSVQSMVAAQEGSSPTNRFAGLELDDDFDEEAIVERDIEPPVSAVAVRAPHQPDMFDGVDLADLILVRKDGTGSLVISSRTLRRAGPVGRKCVVINVKFRNKAKPVAFWFDCNCFRSGSHSVELVTRVLSAIRRLPYVGPCHGTVESTSSLYRFSPIRLLDSFRYPVIGGPTISLEDLQIAATEFFREHPRYFKPLLDGSNTAAELGAKRASIISYQHEQVYFFTTFEALQTDYSQPMNAQLVMVLFGEAQTACLIDQRFYTGPVDKALFVWLNTVSNENYRRYSKDSHYHPLLGSQLNDMNTFLYGSGMDRWSTFSIVKTLILTPGETADHGMMFHWTLSKPLDRIVRTAQ